MNAKFLCVLLSAAVMPALAQPPAAPAQSSAAVTKTAQAAGLTPQVLYQFLLGEIAGQRGDLNLSAEAYADLAMRTRDARVARRATEVALYARQSKLALQNARLWQELEPNSPKALHTLASLLIGASRMSEARPVLDSWIKTGKPAEAFLHLPGLIARQADRKAVLDLVVDLAAAYPALPEAQYAVAQAALQAGLLPKALGAVEAALGLRPNWENAALLKARMIRQKQGEEAALQYLVEFLAANPESREVRLNYARQLARANRFPEARAEFDRLSSELPDNPEIHYAAGLTAMQTNDLESARASLMRALELGHPDESGVRFTLGQLAEASSQWDDALTWFRLVDKGRQVWEAKQHVALVLARQGKVAEARDWLGKLTPRDDAERVQVIQTEAQILREAKDMEGVYALLGKSLEKMPDNPDLLYEHAMVAEKLDRVDVLERDLRRLIKVKPDHAHALNALGYTLADRTTRLGEAIELLERALKLSPDDPFILDSMGWALYKAKRINESVDHLRRAYALRADPEIAAHLGEVLWGKGERDEARRIWQGSLKSNPDNESLRETVSRLTR